MDFRALDQAAAALIEELQKSGTRFVVAESCTSGLIAAVLGRVPGASNVFCGSTVVYRNDTKSRWLGIPPSTFDRYDAVSERVAVEMAERVLDQTPEAGLSASITGHLGPGSPPGLDGTVYTAIALRHNETLVQKFVIFPEKQRRALSAKKAEKLRQKRQTRASLLILFMVRSLLQQIGNMGEK